MSASSSTRWPPAPTAVPILAFTASCFPLAPLVYTLVAIHRLVIVPGRRRTAVRVPPGFGMHDAASAHGRTAR